MTGEVGKLAFRNLLARLWIIFFSYHCGGQAAANRWAHRVLAEPVVVLPQEGFFSAEFMFFIDFMCILGFLRRGGGSQPQNPKKLRREIVIPGPKPEKN